MSLVNAHLDVMMDTVQKQILHEAGISIVNQAGALCPVDNGLLRNSIHYRTKSYDSPFGSDPGLNGGIVNPDETHRIQKPVDTKTAMVGTAVEYASKVENGDPDIPEYPRQPYLSPAARLMEPKIYVRAAQILRGGLSAALG